MKLTQEELEGLSKTVETYLKAHGLIIFMQKISINFALTAGPSEYVTGSINMSGKIIEEIKRSAEDPKDRTT